MRQELKHYFHHSSIYYLRQLFGWRLLSDSLMPHHSSKLTTRSLFSQSRVSDLTYNCSYDTISDMTIIQHSFSHFLRSSGSVLEEVEHGDVRLDRRDGEDVVLVSARREDAIRESFDMSVRTLAVLFRSVEVRALAMSAFEEALPWVGWLSENERSEFVDSFLSTSQACKSTGNYEPLTKLLGRWKASAQIAHDPELAAILYSDRGKDEAISLSRPK